MSRPTDLYGYKLLMMISVPDGWDTYRLEKLHKQFEPAYAAEQLFINLAGAVHVSDMLLSELLELRNHRERRALQAPVIVVNSAFVCKLLELSGFAQPLRVYDSAIPPARMLQIAG